MKARLALAGLVAIFPFTAMAETETASGIEGTVLVSPSRPGPIRSEEPSRAPAGNVEFVVKQGDARVGSFRTDAEGHFHVALPPGHYTVLREDPGARIGHWRFEVEVATGQMAKVDWTADSGMR